MKYHFLCSIFIALAGSTGASAQDGKAVFSRMQNSVYLVRASGQSDSIQGSAVRIGPNAVVTNCHVIANAAAITVMTRKTQHTAKLLHADIARDLCTLSVLDLPPSEIPVVRRLETIRVGERAFALGAPRGLELSLSEGIVSSIRESEVGRLVQTTAPISPGSSGGALFDAESRLLGITSFQRRDSQNLNFAAPAEWIAEISKRHTEQGVARPNQIPEANSIKLVCRGRVKSNEPFKTALNGGAEWIETIVADLDLTQPSLRLKDFYTALLRFRNQWIVSLAAESQKPYALIESGDTLSHGDGEKVQNGDSIRIIAFSISFNRRTAELILVDSDIVMSTNSSDSRYAETRGQYHCEKHSERKF